MKEGHGKELERYIDAATLEEMKANDYKINLIKAREELE